MSSEALAHPEVAHRAAKLVPSPRTIPQLNFCPP